MREMENRQKDKASTLLSEYHTFHSNYTKLFQHDHLKCSFVRFFFVQYSLIYRKSTLFIKKNYLNNVYLQKTNLYKP